MLYSGDGGGGGSGAASQGPSVYSVAQHSKPRAAAEANVTFQLYSVPMEQATPAGDPSSPDYVPLAEQQRQNVAVYSIMPTGTGAGMDDIGSMLYTIDAGGGRECLKVGGADDDSSIYATAIAETLGNHDYAAVVVQQQRSSFTGKGSENEVYIPTQEQLQQQQQPALYAVPPAKAGAQGGGEDLYAGEQFHGAEC